ncbi:hypothetical protein M569_06004, partial [Genlisea aurea]
MDKIKKKRVSVFFDVSVDGDPYERMIFELFADVAPKTAENFRALCTGEKGTSVTTGKPLHYKGTFFHRIIKGYVVQGGDLLRQDGKYGESIYAGNFPGKKLLPLNESAKLKHDGPGLLSMAIADRDERGSIFSITLKADHHLDRKNIVFGKLIDGQDVLKKIEDSGDGDGRPTVTVKIINCGELHEGRKAKGNKSKIGKDASEDNSDELKNKGKHRKSYRKRRKRRRRYSSSSSSDSDSVTDSDIDSSESNTDTDSDESSLSESSSSEDDRRKKKRRSKKERHRRKRRKDRRHGKRRKRRDKKSKRKSRRNSSSDSESDSKSENDDEGVGALNGNGAPLVVAQENAENNQGKGEAAKSSEQQVVHEFPQENGEYHRGNEIGVGIESDRSGNKHLDVVSYDHPNKFSKSMSISPRNDDGSPVEGPKNVSRSASPSRSPARASERSRSRSRSLKGRGVSRSPPLRSRPQQTRGRSASISPTRKRVGRSPPKRSISRSPVRSSRRSLSRSPVKRSRRSISRSPLRSSRRSASRSLDRNPAKRSPSESPGRASRRVRRGSYSRSPRRSPPSDRGRNSSRSPSEDGSPKRIRRGRGFSDRYSYVRRYRSRSPDRSPIRSYRYGRADRVGGVFRYSSYRRSPRRYRSPARGRTPPSRYSRGRRSRSRSPSRSPIRYRSRQRRSWSPVDRYHRGGDGEKQQKRRTASGSSRSRSPSRSSASRKSGENEKGKTRSSPSSSSSSDSPPDDDKGKGLVSYGEDGSP